MLDLAHKDHVFIGFKLDGSLRYQVEHLEGPNGKYVSKDDSSNLRLCLLDGDTYVGKLIEGELTTDRVDDIRRNVLSIMQRLFPDVRHPQVMRIVSCRSDQLTQLPADTPAATGEVGSA